MLSPVIHVLPLLIPMVVDLFVVSLLLLDADHRHAWEYECGGLSCLSSGRQLVLARQLSSAPVLLDSCTATLPSRLRGTPAKSDKPQGAGLKGEFLLPK